MVDYAACIRVKGDKVNKLQPCALPPIAALQAPAHIEQPCRVGVDLSNVKFSLNPFCEIAIEVSMSILISPSGL